MKVRFNKSYITETETHYLMDVFERTNLFGDGYYTKKASAVLQEKFNIQKVLLTTSCSSALDMAAILLDLKQGDEVIMPSYTFVSTANAVVLRGAKPVFAEICEDTLNIDPADIEEKITQNTKAIFPVHYAGVSCDMDAIMDIAGRYGLKVVEDAAQGVNARYKGKYLGTIGDIGCYSFHETKNYTCGEGGAILLNRDMELAKRAEILREKGTNRSQFFRGESDKYTWVDVGSSYLPSELLAAVLQAQLEKLDEIQQLRRQVYDYYSASLKPLEDRGLLKLPVIPPECVSNCHMFYILLNSEKQRNELLCKLKDDGIQALFHYIPLHTSPMGRKLGYSYGDLTRTEELSGRLLRLPLYADLTRNELEYVVEKVKRHLMGPLL